MSSYSSGVEMLSTEILVPGGMTGGKKWKIPGVREEN